MRKGQSLIELVIALGVGVAMLSTASAALFLVLRSGQFSQQTEAASYLGNSLFNTATVISEANWHAIYDLNKSSVNHYFVATSTGQLLVQSGDEKLFYSNTNFTRYFYVDNVSRDSNGNIEPVYNLPEDDPSTQKITIGVSWQINGATNLITSTTYVTRWPSHIFRQSDWSGGSGQTGPIASANNRFDNSTGLDYSSLPGSVLPGSSSCDGCELNSSVIDTGTAGGAALNTIMWQGTLGSGDVKFKIASSNCPNGANNPPTCTTGNWNWSGQPIRPAGPNIQTRISPLIGNNQRYFKYKILIESASLTTPRIDDVIISWSP